MDKSTRGFTIVELLIVIVVIAILAAISLVAYTGMQERAQRSHFQSDISGIKKAMELYRADNGNYPQCPSGPECMYGTSVKSQLEPKYATGLASYNFNYVVQYSGEQERWGMLHLANRQPYYQPQSCKFGVKMATTWYSSAPEC